MAFLKEFYLGSLWKYKLRAIKRIIDGLSDMALKHAKFKFDAEYGWIEVTCLDNEEDEIREKFAIITGQIDDEAFEEHESSILGNDDTLKPSFDNEWFSQGFEISQTDEIDTTTEPTTYAHSGTWTDLDENDEPYTVFDLMHMEQFNRIAEETAIDFSPKIAGRLVEISGHSEESITIAKEKLTVMLDIKKIPAVFRAEHLVYAEDYIDQKDKITADIRYLVNIDPRLASSTLLDRAAVINLDHAYKHLYQEGVSIRLCVWDPKRERQFSLFGPKVNPRSSRKSRWANQPKHLVFKQTSKPVVANSVFSLAPDLSSGFVFKPVLGTKSPPAPYPVQTWVRNLPNSTDSTRESSPHLDSQTKDGSLTDHCPSKPVLEDLIDLLAGSSVPQREAPKFEPFEKTAQAENEIPGLQNAILTSYHSPESSPLETQAAEDFLAVEPSPEPVNGDLISFLDEPSTTCQATCPKAERDYRDGAASKTSNSSSVMDEPIPDSCGAFTATVGLNSGTPHTATTTKSQDSANLTLGEDCLINMFDAVIPVKPDKTLSSKVLTVEAGSNPNMLFTKVLSTYSSDVKDLVNIEIKGSRLWQQAPTRIRTIYSFYCSFRDPEKLRQFVVDIEDDDTSGGNFSYSIRPHTELRHAKKPLPIYVHAICRNWDVRIAIVHSENDAYEFSFGVFARTLVESLCISRNELGFHELKFTIPGNLIYNIQDVRVLTQWRFPSVNNKSALDISEVEQFEMVPCSDEVSGGAGDKPRAQYARPWTQKRSKERRDKGDFPRWYEASVVSVELESLCHQHAALKIGEKASWDPKDLKTRGVFSFLYVPALQMVREMDHVGRSDDNRQAENCSSVLPRPNDPRPGATPLINTKFSGIWVWERRGEL
ncbi:hypothetical protein N0V88_003854 [Collariella sp. IMI 366227]|nr:hypothetical protein N0V88_003854 [Collariella sp. IMI 366227]